MVRIHYRDANVVRNRAHPSNDAYTSDSLAFLLMVFLAARSKRSGLKIFGLFKTIAEDTARYFLVIFTAHFVLVMTLTIGPVSLTAPLQSASSDIQCVTLLSRKVSNFFRARELYQSTLYVTNLIVTSASITSGIVV
jgi:hypothetical protein